MNDFRFIKRILYKLKRKYGTSLRLIVKLSSTPNLDTGLIAVVRDSIYVKRAIVLPATLDQDFTYALAYIASNKNFTYGGYYDVNRCKVIFPKDELPADFEIIRGHYFISEGTRYEVESVTDFKQGFLVVGTQVDSITIQNVIEISLYSTMFISQEASGAI